MGLLSLNITLCLLHAGSLTGGFLGSGHVANILTTGGEEVGLVEAGVGGVSAGGPGF